MRYIVYEFLSSDPQEIQKWLNGETKYSGLRLVAVSGSLYFFEYQ